MTREILFRGKNKYNGKWEEGDLRHIWVFDEYRPHIVDNSNKMNNSVCGCEIMPETVGQYIGTTDKSGRKIFEGDIIKYNNEVFIVNYISGFASFSLGSPHNMRQAPAITTITTNHMEVIGNIYDNPELLEESYGKQQ